jgi:hypothetical protein
MTVRFYASLHGGACADRRKPPEDTLAVRPLARRGLPGGRMIHRVIAIPPPLFLPMSEAVRKPRKVSETK